MQRREPRADPGGKRPNWLERGLFAQLELQQNGIGIAANDLKRVLVYNATRFSTDIKFVPVAGCSRLHFIPSSVASVKSSMARLIPADANPIGYIVGALCDEFFHVRIITHCCLSCTACGGVAFLNACHFGFLPLLSGCAIRAGREIGGPAELSRQARRLRPRAPSGDGWMRCRAALRAYSPEPAGSVAGLPTGEWVTAVRKSWQCQQS